eukprot:COSAG01_NODE_289_length_19391_cov_119.323122_1_plen_54_part_10
MATDTLRDCTCHLRQLHDATRLASSSDPSISCHFSRRGLWMDGGSRRESNYDSP